MRDYDPSIPLLNVDDNLLGQVFYNLARNSVEAIDSSKKGNKLITIAIEQLRKQNIPEL